eukprot:gene10435-14018_t
MKLSIASVLFIFASLINFVKGDTCPNLCSSHGRCISSDRVCQCYEGFTGADCSLKVCPSSRAWTDQATGIDEAHNIAVCSNMGVCDTDTGICKCREGFEGIACERQSCPNQCNHVGECQSMYYYALNKDKGSGVVYDYSLPWDAYKIYGCSCDHNYNGYDCSLRVCPSGDDPLTGTTQISATNPLQFNEIQRVTCKADGGSFTLSYKGEVTKPIPYNAKAFELQAAIEEIPLIGSSNIKLVMYGAQACFDYSTYWTVEFLQNFGSLSLLVPDIRKLTISSALQNSSISVVKVVDGTKENEACSNRGICDTSDGVCTCADNFDTSNGYNGQGTRGDCGYTTETIQYCPGEIACSGHGNCLQNPTYRCECSSGWTGSDCSDRLCPKDLAWFALPESDHTAHLSTYAECSNAGLCERSSGTCICNEGFTGAACSRLTCPGASSDTDGCSGHGQCLDMNSLAALATVNGVLGGFTYGDTPNKPSTWDATRVFGCYCDSGYAGYDCSLYICPYGDDPDTRNQLDEKQIISCTDSDGSGNIVLKFREQSTASISPTATTAEVKSAIESLSTIGEVAVEVYEDDDSDQLCTSSGVINQFVITFLTDHSDLPLIQITSQDVDSIDIKQYVAGTKENKVCSGRGICDETTGICQCFEGYGSSNGKGGSGSLRDCGYTI